MLVPQIFMSQAVKYPQTEHVNHCFLFQKQWIRALVLDHISTSSALTVTPNINYLIL